MKTLTILMLSVESICMTVPWRDGGASPGYRSGSSQT